MTHIYMKRIAILLACTLACAFLTLGCNSEAPVARTSVDEADIAALAGTSHPRLVMDRKDFKKLFKTVRRDLAKGVESPVVLMHRSIMKRADAALEEAPLEYKKDISNKRILHVSNSALHRIGHCAYAYLFTGEAKYLEHAEMDINTVCDFADWNPSHYLDTGEMGAAVAFGYDWLYDALSPETRAKAEKVVKTHIFDSRIGRGFYKVINNWNQVCNGGVVAAAIAFADIWPEEALGAVNDAITSNIPCMETSYSPDGAYREGPGYWSYGTHFQILLDTELKKAFGTDFGLSDIQGFDRTMDYYVSTRGNAGKCFDYSDNGDNISPEPALWYFAARFGKEEMLFNELELLRERGYSTRLLPVFIQYAMKVDPDRIKAPATLTYSGQGGTPVVMTRTGWGPQDLYLGVKGGTAAENHAHMDAGSFVYDAYGQRWSMDLVRQSYAEVENLLWENGGEYWAMKQESMRWRLCRINNRFHSTLTVNDEDHVMKGFATLEEVYDTNERRGALLDMTGVFGDALASVKREAVIQDGSFLRVTDSMEAGDKPAVVRWSMATPAEPELTEGGIILRAGGVEMLLHAEGADVDYRIWSGNCRDYEGIIPQREAPYPTPVWIVGFETEVPASAAVTTVTTLKKN